jgi:hypothetical protein
MGTRLTLMMRDLSTGLIVPFALWMSAIRNLWRVVSSFLATRQTATAPTALGRLLRLCLKKSSTFATSFGIELFSVAPPERVGLFLATGSRSFYIYLLKNNLQVNQKKSLTLKCLFLYALGMTIKQIINTLTFNSYAHNRLRSPDISPERWAKVYGKDSELLEKAFQFERFRRAKQAQKI